MLQKIVGGAKRVLAVPSWRFTGFYGKMVLLHVKLMIFVLPCRCRGTATTQTVYIKNTGNIPETLTITTNNWNPTNATSSLTLTWNRQNTILNAGTSIQATLTLTAASNTGSLTTFSCDVTLTGTQ